ncbi:hypothetical protein JTB14_030149 [Gonioctena quinquepunctata]|nr:hypothetical protein JTB14_030149 [Gonioctena quinquepunctata]
MNKLSPTTCSTWLRGITYSIIWIECKQSQILLDIIKVKVAQNLIRTQRYFTNGRKLIDLNMPKDDELPNKDLFDKLLEAIQITREKSKGEIMKNIFEENKKLIELFEKQNEKIKVLEAKFSQLDKSSINLERHSRKNNIIIFGLGKLSHSNLVKEVIQKLNSILGINLNEQDLNNKFPLNPVAEAPIKLEFLSYLKRRKIFEYAYKLQG